MTRIARLALAGALLAAVTGTTTAGATTAASCAGFRAFNCPSGCSEVARFGPTVVFCAPNVAQ